ncbi:MAG: type II toxin-antitoxin system HicA family toxin, partial [bacterium]
MNSNEKLLERAKNNPKNLSFAEFESVMKKCGWRKVHQKGSHHIWCSPFGFRLSIQPMTIRQKVKMQRICSLYCGAG